MDWINPVRLGFVLIIAGIILIVGTIGAFVYFFYAQGFSTNASDWGAFGSYVGGVLGVSISILALIGAVIAIYQQHRTGLILNNQRLASDLMRSIERLEDSINAALKELTVSVNYPKANHVIDSNAFIILTGIQDPEVIKSVIPEYSTTPNDIKANIIGEEFNQKNAFEKIKLYEVFSSACGELKFMRDLLVKHKALVGHNATAIFYSRKYKVLVERLNESGYPLELWDDIDSLP